LNRYQERRLAAVMIGHLVPPVPFGVYSGARSRGS